LYLSFGAGRISGLELESVSLHTLFLEKPNGIESLRLVCPALDTIVASSVTLHTLDLFPCPTVRNVELFDCPSLMDVIWPSENFTESLKIHFSVFSRHASDLFRNLRCLILMYLIDAHLDIAAACAIEMLEQLTVIGCNGLRALELTSARSLKELIVKDCQELQSMLVNAPLCTSFVLLLDPTQVLSTIRCSLPSVRFVHIWSGDVLLRQSDFFDMPHVVEMRIEIYGNDVWSFSKVKAAAKYATGSLTFVVDSAGVRNLWSPVLARFKDAPFAVNVNVRD
jgi:hypothetical protein